jgi:hypothetical protein
MGEAKEGNGFSLFFCDILVFRKVGKMCFPMLNVLFWVFFVCFWHSSTIKKFEKALIQCFFSW